MLNMQVRFVIQMANYPQKDIFARVSNRYFLKQQCEYSTFHPNLKPFESYMPLSETLSCKKKT